MSSGSYTYDERKGIRPISWNDFHGLVKGLVLAVTPYKPQLILAVGRAGFYPGTLMAHMMQVELFPVRVSRRVNDVVQFKTPQWKVRPPELVKDQRVLIVDEICDTGETLRVVKDEVQRLGATEVRTAVLYSHTPAADIPDYIGLISDQLLLNPWDREIYHNGEFVFHPEYVGALKMQGVAPDDSLLVGADPIKIAKP